MSISTTALMMPYYLTACATALLLFFTIPAQASKFPHRSSLARENRLYSIGLKEGIPNRLMSLLYQQRIRRGNNVCTASDFAQPDIQQAVFSMVTGNAKHSWPVGVKSPKVNSQKHNAGVCSSTSDETTTSSEIEISPDMPIEMRAFCGFQYEDNVKERRLPKLIREVKCLCNEPRSKLVAERFPELRCEPLYYDVPVLTFDETCSKFEQSTEKIALACVPVITSQSMSGFKLSVGNAKKPTVEI
uniref:Uncharacterized protein n=1 Tax=Ditylenchus dipsaci TaxID=166011 RepID=A0A915D1F5_9BILA